MKYPFLILSIFLLTSCAITRDRISLGYEPISGVKKIPKAENTKIDVSVNDNRKDKDQVGRKINGYGMQMGPIICENQVDEVVKEALLTELINRGFVPSPHDPQILVNVELNKMCNKFKAHFWTCEAQSKTILTIKLQNPDGSIKYDKTIIGKAKIDNIYVAWGKNAKIALEQSLQHAVVQIVEDPEFINALLKEPMGLHSLK